MLENGGSAIDATIAALLCEGVVMPQSAGLGGGFFATIYEHDTRTVVNCNARETAPLSSKQDMFINLNAVSDVWAKSCAVPGEILGYWEMHQRYGKLPWETLFKPAIDLCRTGHTVSPYLAQALKKHEDDIKKEPSMSEVFINSSTGNAWEEGDVIKREKLAETLEIISKEGADTFYQGGIVGLRFIKDMNDLGGIITEEDLKQYCVIWDTPVCSNFCDYQIYSAPIPGGGPVLTFIMNLLECLLTDDEPLMYARMVECFKHGYGQRSQLGDMLFESNIDMLSSCLVNPNFADKIRRLIEDNKTTNDHHFYGARFANNEDHGTVNVCVLAPNGDAISITSTINTAFGAKVRSMSTGIILNDEMDDFSTPGIDNVFGYPPSPANFIKPTKRPMSSMCPSIVLNKTNDVLLVLGAAGGSKIISIVAQVLFRYLFLKESIENAVKAKRLHHQLSPMVLLYEKNFKQSIINHLQNIGHKVECRNHDNGFAAITAIAVNDYEPTPVFDPRRKGCAAVMTI